MSENERPRILIVDDEEAILETMTFTFMDVYEVLTTSDPTQAIGIMEENAPIAVVITDTFGRPWRKGVTDVAIGSAGITPVLDLRGTTDALGRELQVTEVAIIDEIAAAADLVMGKSAGCPAAIVRGIPSAWFKHGSVAADIVRRPQDDLFR